MPIPPLQNKSRSPQNWRDSRKDYTPRRTSSLHSRLSNSKIRKPKNLKEFSDLFSDEFKRKALKFFGLAVLAGALILLVMVFWISRNLPDPGQLIDREVAQTTKIYDRTGENVLYEIHGDQQRTIVALKDLPAYVAQATIAMEDKDFYKHGGISFWGILRGVIWKPLTGNGMQGGSTLTQQFVKNAILTNE
ncbi:MAG: transglycosylase domain-containing protein, partial [Candidatus Magasanikbacteria bacterium]|nr:transglycosylase domain-containing protein [Candidatus Magasanikbacteria bacterium]